VRKRVRQISKEEVLNCLLENPQYVELLRRAVQIEEAHRGDKRWLGWSWDELPAHPATINKLIIKGLVYKSYDSAKFTHYKLVNLEATKWALRELETLQNQPATPVEEREAEIPPDMFDVVEGYDDLKEFILASLNADEPVHILLVGSPGTAKSLLLSEIERLEGARYIPMGTATKVGIRDILFEEMPRYLIVDDLDKLSDKGARAGFSPLQTGFQGFTRSLSTASKCFTLSLTRPRSSTRLSRTTFARGKGFRSSSPST